MTIPYYMEIMGVDRPDRTYVKKGKVYLVTNQGMRIQKTWGVDLKGQHTIDISQSISRV